MTLLGIMKQPNCATPTLWADVCPFVTLQKNVLIRHELTLISQIVPKRFISYNVVFSKSNLHVDHRIHRRKWCVLF